MDFIDTNIFIYTVDTSDVRKTKLSRQLIRDLRTTNTGCISTQVVQEFCNVALKKSAIPLNADDVADIITTVFKKMALYTPGTDFYLNALKLYASHSLSFYDTLILQAAIEMGCSTLYSEDLQAGQKIGGVTIVNPFA